MVQYLKVLGKWDPDLKTQILCLLADCPCTLAKHKRLMPVPKAQKVDVKEEISYIIIDLVCIDRVRCLRMLDRGTKFSVNAMGSFRHTATQISTINNRWRSTFGAPITIKDDQEYKSK